MAALKYTRETLIERMGADPTEWAFFGQVYDCGTKSVTTCAVTERPTRHCYILRKADKSAGKVTIGPSAFPYIARWNPKLLTELEKGRAWFLLHLQAVRTDARFRAAHVRRIAAETAWRKLVEKGLRLADTVEQRLGTANTPEQVLELGHAALRVLPPFKSEANRATWYANQSLHLEALLKEAEPYTGKKPAKKVAVVTQASAPVILPAIQHEAPTPVVLPGIDDVVFEDIFQ